MFYTEYDTGSLRYRNYQIEKKILRHGLGKESGDDGFAKAADTVISKILGACVQKAPVTHKEVLHALCDSLCTEQLKSRICC